MSDTRKYTFTGGALDGDTLVALLSELPFDAFEQSDHAVSAYVTATAADASLDAAVTELAAHYELSVATELIADRNWNQVWEDNFAPAEVGDFLRVRAPFHAPAAGFAIELEIVPEMSFGTGHHETTHMMAELLRDHPPSGKTVFDFGTGTGVLALVAKRLGAAHVAATDYDPRCVASTLANAARNRLSLDHVALGDADEMPPGRFDLVLANIQRSVLIPGMPALAQRLAPGGQLWMSGLLEPDFPDVDGAAAAEGLRCMERRQRGKWLALRYGRKLDL